MREVLDVVASYKY